MSALHGGTCVQCGRAFPPGLDPSIPVCSRSDCPAPVPNTRRYKVQIICSSCSDTRHALRTLLEWVSRMPDAGLAEGDPRYEWWFGGGVTRQYAQDVLALEEETLGGAR